MTSELVGLEPQAFGGSAEAPISTELDRLGAGRFINRELSWLDFAERLLDLADDPAIPLLERVKFLAIFSNGIDEFFQVRVAGLKDQVAAGIRTLSSDGHSAEDQLQAIRVRAQHVIDRQSTVFGQSILPELASAGIYLLDHAALDEVGKSELAQVFEREIFPVLTPLAVDPGHPFPYISNLSLNLAVVVEDRITKENRFARIKVPPLLPRFVPLSDGERFVPLEQVIAAHTNQLFPEMDVGEHHAFRVTRNADLDLEDSEADDLLVAVEVELRRRRFGRAVRLEVDVSMPSDVRSLLLRELELTDQDAYTSKVPLDLGQLFALSGMARPDLRYPDWTPTTQPRLSPVAVDEPLDMFAVLRERDILVQHPYDSFGTSVEEFISQAAEDPDVLAIKQTLYRTSGDAPFVFALIRAAEAGKQVAALVELKARFDEQRNITWARQLEQAGVHVVYGVVGLKTHSKTALVVRREPDGIRRYCHVGSGNYNSDTARIYEDLGFLTSNPKIGADLTDLFNHLTGFSRSPKTRSLVLAPDGFRSWVLEAIAGQAAIGESGEIAIKVNGLTDPEIIDALYRASQAGVPIDLIVRGVCSLRPGVPGLSDSIRVRSIVGRFLEHSRIYRFGRPSEEVTAHCVVGSDRTPVIATGASAQYVLGSADLMERNLDRRIEALVPIEDVELCARLEDVLRLLLADDTFSWSMSEDGSWQRIVGKTKTSVQRSLMRLALDRSRRRFSHEGNA